MHSVKCKLLQKRASEEKQTIYRTTVKRSLDKGAGLVLKHGDLGVFSSHFIYMKASSCPCWRAEAIKAQPG